MSQNSIVVDWKNIHLPTEVELNLIENLTFDGLLLEINCNIKEINKETVRAQFEEDLRNRIEEAREIFESNLNNIVKHAQKERKKP